MFGVFYIFFDLFQKHAYVNIDCSTLCNCGLPSNGDVIFHCVKQTRNGFSWGYRSGKYVIVNTSQ